MTVRGGKLESERINNDLESMQRIVGGYIEHVALRGRFQGISMWVNETGLVDGLPRWPQPVYPGPIAGDYLFTRTDAYGETVGLTPKDVNLLHEAFNGYDECAECGARFNARPQDKRPLCSECR